MWVVGGGRKSACKVAAKRRAAWHAQGPPGEPPSCVPPLCCLCALAHGRGQAQVTRTKGLLEESHHHQRSAQWKMERASRRAGGHRQWGTILGCQASKRRKMGKETSEVIRTGRSYGNF